MAERVRRPQFLLLFMLLLALASACGEGRGVHWIAAWNTSWTGPESPKPVSRDGRYAYFTTEKFINPDRGEWAQSWRSPLYRGRVDLVTGKVDTGSVPAGWRFFGYEAYLISDSLATRLKSKTIPVMNGGREMRHHGYGDGRFILLICRPGYDTGYLTTFLLDNEDTYRVIGTGFRDGWIATDEKSVVLIKNSGDTWLYDIDASKLRKLGPTETPPRFIRGLQDLPPDVQQRAGEAMGRHCAQRQYDYYPKEEELR